MTLLDRINDIRGRSHHEKRRVVYGVATLCTALVAVTWLGTSLATNSFAVTLPAPASSGVQAAPQGTNGRAQYAGAASALAPSPANQEASGVEIISTATSSTLSKGKSGQTIIPF